MPLFTTHHRLGHCDRMAVHNLKYFTWVEQQQKAVGELNAQWYDRTYWTEKWKMAPEYDRLIGAFNARTGLMARYAK